MNIAGLSKAAVLAALYNAAQTQGRGFLRHDAQDMTEDQAQEILDGGQTDFDYLKGRVMKVDLSGNEVDTHLYNRDNGPNTAETVIEALRH